MITGETIYAKPLANKQYIQSEEICLGQRQDANGYCRINYDLSISSFINSLILFSPFLILFFSQRFTVKNERIKYQVTALEKTSDYLNNLQMKTSSFKQTRFGHDDRLKNHYKSEIAENYDKYHHINPPSQFVEDFHFLKENFYYLDAQIHTQISHHLKDMLESYQTLSHNISEIIFFLDNFCRFYKSSPLATEQINLFGEKIDTPYSAFLNAYPAFTKALQDKTEYLFKKAERSYF